MSFQLYNCRIDSLFPVLHLPIDVLRLDLIHPVVSGNKWFKLKYYLQQAKQENKTTLATWGGAFSNHIVATAFAAQTQGLKSIGIIRGEEPKVWSHTLLAAKGYGMTLYFVSREAYRQKQLPKVLLEKITLDDMLEIPEGGFGVQGAEGAKEILDLPATLDYTHIITAVGTGTTLAGLCLAASKQQKIIGISVLKNALSLPLETKTLLPDEKKQSFELIADYDFGGYAKRSHELIEFMNNFYTQTGIPTDFVYTAKAFYGVIDLYKKNHFEKDPRLLLIHTGGLQGNLSLPNGTLIFGQTKT